MAGCDYDYGYDYGYDCDYDCDYDYGYDCGHGYGYGDAELWIYKHTWDPARIVKYPPRWTTPHWVLDLIRQPCSVTFLAWGPITTPTP